MDEKIYWMDQYSERFGDNVPTEPDFYTTEELILFIKKCLKENKPYEHYRPMINDADY